MKVLLDSKLVAGKVNKAFKAKDQRMKVYCGKVVQLMKCFQRIDVQAIKRKLNARADQLAKGVAYGEYNKKNRHITIDEHRLDVNMVEVEDELRSDTMKESWMDLIIDY